MQLKTKKTIAKEVILFLSSIVLAVVVFLLVYPYNWYCSSKFNDIQALITLKTIQSDSLITQYNLKLKQQEWLHAETPGFNSYVDLWNKLEEYYKADSIVYKYNLTWNKDLITVLDNMGFHNAQDFKEFVEKNIVTQKDKENKKESDEIKTQIYKLKFELLKWDLKIFSMDEQLLTALKALIITLIFIYPIRFLYWLIVWSVKTIKLKEEKE